MHLLASNSGWKTGPHDLSCWCRWTPNTTHSDSAVCAACRWLMDGAPPKAPLIISSCRHNAKPKVYQSNASSVASIHFPAWHDTRGRNRTGGDIMKTFWQSMMGEAREQYKIMHINFMHEYAFMLHEVVCPDSHQQRQLKYSSLKTSEIQRYCFS